MTRWSMTGRIKWAVLGATLVISLGACSQNNDIIQVERSAEELYTIAYEEATSGNIGQASPLFDEVERQHPYSKWASQAQLMSAWALYQSNSYDAAVLALNRFISLNPAHPDIDYAYYLIAMSYYDQIVDVERDAGKTVDAKEAFEALINRFPDSKYTRDAQLKHDLTLSHLAGKEMAIGRFYLKDGHYDAALRRFANVVQNYERSNQTPEALYRMVESFLALGLDSEATRTGAVMVHNYENSVWTNRMNDLIGDPTLSHETGFFDQILQRFSG